jgi:hypothetical protein
MYAIYGNIYHQYTPNVSIYTIHGSYIGNVFHQYKTHTIHPAILSANLGWSNLLDGSPRRAKAEELQSLQRRGTAVKLAMSRVNWIPQKLDGTKNLKCLKMFKDS